ncbi:MAG TPA: BatA domain-containing protein, partial [Puia sp.]|nr:BatA domain-containing protein [Puia sp.]
MIIHLWNDRRGKILRIGNIDLLAETSRSPVWSPRITEPWLLLVRCLLVMALALLLAGPYLQRRARGKGWVLVRGAGGPYGRMIDSLVAAGFERHGLEDSVDYWDGFRKADRLAPGELPFYMVTPGLARRFSGQRPVSARDVHWYTYTPEDSIAEWVQEAWRDSGRVRVLGGYSRSTGTVWRRTVDAGTMPVAVDTSVFRYRIVADGAWRGNAKYVRAALGALRHATGRPIVEGDGGWLFWLSERPLPPTEGFGRVFCYAAGAPVT